MEQARSVSNELNGASKVSDMEFVRRVQQGEKKVFAELVRRHQRKLYWVIQGMLQSQPDAEEIVQETFFKALKHIEDLRGESQFSTWLIQIAINEARFRRRKDRMRRHDSIDEANADDPGSRPRELADWRRNPEQELERKELEELAHKAVRSLPEKYREVVLLRDVQQLSNEEVARILQISNAAVKTRVLRARLMMRDFLAPHFKMRWQDRLMERIKRRRSA